MLVAGVDSSTQSTKVLLCQAEDGTVLGRGSAPHPPGTECDPAAWWSALEQAGHGLLDRADAVAVAAQQHGMVVLDEASQVIRPALLWNDLRSAPAARELIAERGGPGWWARHTGSVPSASFTVTKLRWLAEHEPANAARVARVLLPHDWLTWRLSAAGAAGRAAEPVTDRGDASGTGYFSPAAGHWLPGVAASALGHEPGLPRIAKPAEAIGETAGGAVLAPGTGDNMGAALGLGLEPGELVTSIGTSGTAYAVTERPAADESGMVAGFADATGRYLPLIATVNAGLVLSAVAALTGTDLHGLSARALAAGPGAGGIVLLPYLDGERSPNRPDATGVLRGLTTRNATGPNLARAAIEAVLGTLAEAADLIAAQGASRQRVLLIGGGARSEAVRRIAPGIFGVPVLVPAPEEYVALGAARQAAWALAGTPEPPGWPRIRPEQHTGPPDPGVRQRLAWMQKATTDWDSAGWDTPVWPQ
ncbi:MAG TPA: FGGY family carbohydrate kinase [Streptosporangiaceae bacterium]|nr:FGGY family carbohydrate kinase [Streptosporangiaceae bacterium]